MNFISTPLTIDEVVPKPTDHDDHDDNAASPPRSFVIRRDIDDPVAMLDNLVELIVFTPKGSFAADPDFGFEYLNHEYVNVPHHEFNEGHISFLTTSVDDKGVEKKKVVKFVTLTECKESIRQSLEIYAPQLKDVNIGIKLDNVEEEYKTRKLHSRCKVSIVVEGVIADELQTMREYQKEVVFLIEPTVKKIKR